MEYIYDLLLTLGLPVAYSHFAEGEMPVSPYIVYYETGTDNFAADGKVYHKIETVAVELYTETKSPATEAALETVFDNAEVCWQSSETWIDSEKLYEVRYTIEV